MQPIIALLLGAFLLGAQWGDANTLDFRDCTPHTEAEAAAYYQRLRSQGLPEKDAIDLAYSYQTGDGRWGDEPCPGEPEPIWPAGEVESRTLPQLDLPRVITPPSLEQSAAARP